MNLIDLEKRFPYDKKLSIKGKELRKNMTEPERRLWFRFFKSFQQTYNIRVLKQRPIHNFIVDFYISQFKLVIEIDGENHFEKQQLLYDKERTNTLNSLGLRVIRFTNKEVIENFDGVCKKILMEVFGDSFVG